jgi:hypothetical protein
MDRGLIHRGTTDEARSRRMGDAPSQSEIQVECGPQQEPVLASMTRLNGCEPKFDGIPEEVFGQMRSLSDDCERDTATVLVGGRSSR